MREKLQKRLDRLNKVKTKGVSEEKEEAPEEPVVKEEEEVNFEAWLRGEVDYETFILFPAWAKLKGRKHSKLRDLVEDLVLDEQVVSEEEMSPRLRGLLSPESE